METLRQHKYNPVNVLTEERKAVEQASTLHRLRQASASPPLFFPYTDVPVVSIPRGLMQACSELAVVQSAQVTKQKSLNDCVLGDQTYVETACNKCV
jgi:hypothetical protein